MVSTNDTMSLTMYMLFSTGKDSSRGARPGPFLVASLEQAPGTRYYHAVNKDGPISCVCPPLSAKRGPGKWRTERTVPERQAVLGEDLRRRGPQTHSHNYDLR